MTYNPNVNSRESAKHYISATEAELQAMLTSLGLSKLEELYNHIPDSAKFDKPLALPDGLSWQKNLAEMERMAGSNKLRTSFIGDGLKAYKVSEVTGPVCDIRELTTSYTPYQPERSQGSLTTFWIYQSLIAQITGFEAINASMYDRATTLFEVIKTSLRISKKGQTVIVLDSIYPGDREVLETHVIETGIKLAWVECAAFPITGQITVDAIKKVADAHEGDVAAIVIPQINNVGTLADVDALTDYTHSIGALAIGVVDPILLGTGGLKPPAQWGAKGADLFVAEGQHLAIGPNFGGPGLGIFGIRYNAATKNNIRATAGRFVGDAKDEKGRRCKLLILSTREQHIKREKANSNICSNQAYIATVAGAALLARGEQGLKDAFTTGRRLAAKAASELTKFPGVELAFPGVAFVNEFTLKLPKHASEVIKAGLHLDVEVGVDVSERIGTACGSYLMICFTDLHSEADIAKLSKVFENVFGPASKAASKIAEIPAAAHRQGELGMISFTAKEVIAYYQKLATQNITPDSTIYPLGSCTMKYNPYLNDHCAALPGFALSHPQAPIEDVQGNIELIYQTQEWFKAITGLAGVTTQPVAGAQGELCGLKLFQAYHAERGEKRDIILIPHTAHGTNPATAAVAGIDTKILDGVEYGIVEIDANSTGEVLLDQVEAHVKKYGKRIIGVMCTNPNTSGVFETNFAKMAELVHSVGGLVYMDGANMNAIAGWVNLAKIGVDAVHNNTHKTWTIPHGGGGPGDAFVAVSEKLLPYLPGIQAVKLGEGSFTLVRAPKSIGSFHRHHGNFAHKVRCLTYLYALGGDGIKKMSAVAVLSARYLFSKLSKKFKVLPSGNHTGLVMHEFILTLPEELFAKIEAVGVPKSLIISRVGKLFLDYGFHAPTVAFPEQYGLMVEPTESYTKGELDKFADACLAIYDLIDAHPEVLTTVPHFTPIDRVMDVEANKNPIFSERLTALPEILPNRTEPGAITKLPLAEVREMIIAAHKKAKQG